MENLPQLKGVRWLYVQSHWDIHLSGVVLYNDKKYVATLTYDPWEHWNGEGEEPEGGCQYTVYEAPKWFMVLQSISQWFFERCVGLHWTYPYRAMGWHYTPKAVPALKFFYKVYKPLVKKYDTIYGIIPQSKAIGIWTTD